MSAVGTSCVPPGTYRLSVGLFCLGTLLIDQEMSVKVNNAIAAVRSLDEMAAAYPYEPSGSWRFRGLFLGELMLALPEVTEMLRGRDASPTAVSKLRTGTVCFEEVAPVVDPKWEGV